MRYSVRRYTEDDGPRLLALLQSAFGRWPADVCAADRPLEFLNWKHLSNPAGASMLALAEEGGELVAARAYMEWPLERKGTKVAARQAVDLATDPARRRRGTNTELIAKVMESYGGAPPLTLGLPNEMSRAQSRRQSWRIAGRVPVWVRLRRPSRGRAAEPDAPPAAGVLAGRDRLEELLRDVRRADGRLATVRSADHLLWRYRPFIGDYRAIAEEDGGRLSGLAVFRLRRPRELCEASICELLVRPGDDRVARRLLRRVAEAAPADYLAALPGPHSVGADVLLRAGFAPSPVRRLPLGVVVYSPVEPDPYRRASWALGLGDFDRLRHC
jgi:hypothetical protein